MKLGIYTVATLNHSYALKAQARALQSACMYAGIDDLVVVLVTAEDDFFEEVKKEYENLFEKAKIILIKREEFFDCDKRKKYKNEVQLMISQMRTLATNKLISENCDRVLSMDSDVLPKHNSIQCMMDMLDFDKGYYDVVQCPYPSQGGGAFLGGRGTKARPILEDFSIEERKIPKKIKKERTKLIEELESFFERLNSNQEPRTKEISDKIDSMQKNIRDLEAEMSKYPPKANVFTLNGKQWKKRGWFDYAYPAIGKGSIVPVDWVGFGCTMMSRKAASLCDWSGYDGGGTEDLYIIWHRWHQYDIKIANIAHCPSDHIVRDRGDKYKYIHVQTYHEENGEHEGHLRQSAKPWYAQDVGEKYNKKNNGTHTQPEKEEES
jgi:hypothetical protein